MRDVVEDSLRPIPPAILKSLLPSVFLFLFQFIDISSLSLSLLCRFARLPPSLFSSSSFSSSFSFFSVPHRVS